MVIGDWLISKPLITNPITNHSSPDFFGRVHALVRTVPRGRVTTYGAIARQLGTGRSSRMVGWAMNAAHNAVPPVPAHRVVNRLGLLTGKMHFVTPTQMEELLEAEGIEVHEDKVTEFKKLFWEEFGNERI